MVNELGINDKLLEEARILGKHATKSAAVNEALAEYIQRRKQWEIITLFHSIEYEDDYDYKDQRSKR